MKQKESDNMFCFKPFLDNCELIFSLQYTVESCFKKKGLKPFFLPYYIVMKP